MSGLFRRYLLIVSGLVLGCLLFLVVTMQTQVTERWKPNANRNDSSENDSVSSQNVVFRNNSSQSSDVFSDDLTDLRRVSTTAGFWTKQSSPTMSEYAVKTVLDARGDDTSRHEALEYLHRVKYHRIIDILESVLSNPNEGERFRSFCIQHLWMNLDSGGQSEVARVVLLLHNGLTDKDLPIRREALLALARMGDPLGQETAVKWLLDENASNTRDLAIRCVHDLNMKEHIPTIRKYLYDPDEVIRIAAIVALSQWDDEESRPAFSAAAKSDSIRVQRAGQAALTRLSQPIPPNSNP